MSATRAHRSSWLKKRRKLPRCVPFAIAMAARLLRRTFRLRVTDHPGLLDNGQPWPAVFILWHNRILFLADCMPRHLRRVSAVLISGSRDGEYASDYIRHFGMQVVRGSSSRGGLRAVRELRRKLEGGVSTVITLDGPRGPRYEVQAGAALLAQHCGVPILPLSLNAPARWEVNSWDRTQIPKPFTKVELRIGTPVYLSSGPDALDREEACQLLRASLLEVTDDDRPQGAGATADEGQHQRRSGRP